MGNLDDFRFAFYKVSAAKKVIFFCRFRALHACFYIGLDQRLRMLSPIAEAAAAGEFDDEAVANEWDIQDYVPVGVFILPPNDG